MENDPLVERAFKELYPKKRLRKVLKLRYSGRFRGYNAHVENKPFTIAFSLSKRFLEVDDEMKIGVIQHLLNKLYKTHITTMEIELYNKFLKHLTDYAETTSVDPILKERFEIINKKYFNGFMLTPNLVWGTRSLTKLGHYEFATDTISLSTVLKEDEELLDYVLYHEMLHKKHKFSERPGGYTRSHTKIFREEEKRFKLADKTNPERRLEEFLRKMRRGGPRQERPKEKRGFFRTLFDYF